MIAVIGAMEEEVQILKHDMQDVKTEKVSCFEFYLGKIHGKETVLLRCGIGKVQAAVGCTTLINKYAPSCVINTGSAGGINPHGAESLNFGDAVISSGLIYHDVDLTVFGYKKGQLPGQNSEVFPVRDNLIKAAEDAVRDLQKEDALPVGFKAIPGLICSGDVFLSDSKRARELAELFPGVRAVEMESAAIAHSCTLFNTPYLVLRCLSDIAGEESPLTFDEYLPIAAQNSSAIVKRIIQNLQFAAAPMR
ncbi:MAG: 5'-methylthioadenosine/adenosylhomocysteine nucleosidase [Spirochaetaceae bacterium]|nr:5'-methylthioadenosine/adenosylhomocysteine nucleosidase [Spirochaetaceae bacterium]